MFWKLKKFTSNKKKIGKYKIFLNETYEMPKSFIDVILDVDIQSRQVVTNADGVEICLATFRTIAAHDDDKMVAMLAMFDLNERDKTKNYYMS